MRTEEDHAVMGSGGALKGRALEDAPGTAASARDLFILLRPHQWIKNLFVFAALVFSGNLFHPEMLARTVAAFVIFCALSGSVYVLNDIMDVAEDRCHPRKKKRPVAAGRITSATAWTAHVLLASCSLAAAFFLNTSFGALAAVYYAMNVGYSLGLKRAVIIDVMIVAAGFVIRAAAGGLAISVNISHWLLVCTTLLALFLVLAKRRHEIILMGDRANLLMELSLAAEDMDRAARYRNSLEEYNPYFLDQLIGVTTATTLMAYILYTLSKEAAQHFGGPHLIYTAPFVIYGIFRYLYLIHLKKEGGSPARTLVADRPLLADIFLWVVSVVVILYS